MMVFFDTGAWVAIADESDQYAQQAGRTYTRLVLKREQLVTSDLVLIETYNLLLRTIGNKATRDFADKLKLISSLQIVTVTQTDSARARNSSWSKSGIFSLG